MIDYAYVGYWTYPQKVRSHTCYLFTYGGTIISWCPMKKIMFCLSSNNVGIIATQEFSRECVWLRLMTQHSSQSSSLVQTKLSTILYKYNSSWIAQLKGGYIKGDWTKHISSKFFFKSSSTKWWDKCSIDSCEW